MYCKNCGQEIPDEAQFCDKCGTPVEGTSPEAVQETEGVFTQTAAAAPTFPMNTQQDAASAPEAETRSFATDATSGSFTQTPAAPASPYAEQTPAAPASPYAEQPPSPFSDQPATGTYSTPAAAPAYGSAQAAPTYGAPSMPNAQGSDIGTTPLVLGILSIVLAVVLGWTFIGPIAGIVLGILAISKGKKALALEPNNGKAKGGRVTGIIGLILSILALVFTIVLTAVLGIALTEAINNPDTISNIMEEVEQAPMTDEERQAWEDIKQELGVEDTEDSSTFMEPAAPVDYTGGQKFDSWAAECTAEGDQPTLYALTELKGWQLETLLQQLGYQWYPDIDSWLRESDGTYYGMIGNTGVLSDLQIAEGDKGGTGTGAYHVMVLDGFTSARDALNKMGQLTMEDVKYSDDEQSALAVIYGPSMTEYLVMVTPSETDGEGFYTFFVFPEETCASGLFDVSYGGGDSGRSIEEIWKNFTGGAVGDYVSSQQQ